jgi:hypothetical protein
MLSPNRQSGFCRRNCHHFSGGLGADFFGLLLGKDTFSHKGIKQRLIAFRLRVRDPTRT